MPSELSDFLMRLQLLPCKAFLFSICSFNFLLISTSFLKLSWAFHPSQRRIPGATGADPCLHHPTSHGRTSRGHYGSSHRRHSPRDVVRRRLSEYSEFHDVRGGFRRCLADLSRVGRRTQPGRDTGKAQGGRRGGRVGQRAFTAGEESWWIPRLLCSLSDTYPVWGCSLVRSPTHSLEVKVMSVW